MGELKQGLILEEAMQREELIAEIVQNLRDAGCERDKIERFLAEFESGCRERQLRLLRQHRDCLLNRVHAEERKIECLDYLIYQLCQKEDARL
ncbi:MAG: hypothetical protein Q4C01_05930 [Clostridia bacterium]|nr:hypothetical protein [Clostridia bacterium]